MYLLNISWRKPTFNINWLNTLVNNNMSGGGAL